jgi:uncharacterized repeat protein (TIGR03806 family)
MSNERFLDRDCRYIPEMSFGHLKSAIPALLLASVLASCGGGGSGNNNPPPPPPPVTVGLDARPSNTSCVAPARASVGTIEVVDAFPNLPNIGSPTKALVEPVPDPRWFVLRKSGQLVVFDPENATTPEIFLDLTLDRAVRTNSEGGLLGMAFHPDYPAVPEVFLYYTIDGPGSVNMRSHISRFILDDVSSPGVGTVEQVIIVVDQFADNHNGGDIAFGADRLLYIGLGDGGGGGDPRETGQNTMNLLGSMLRIDVIGTGAGYDIPGSNPFPSGAKCGPTEVNGNDCPEIYAWGLRNPWRWSFDAPTGDLWLADVGQGNWEEIDLILPGRNYGWDCREGAHDFESSGCAGPFEEPVAEYNHANGNVSITGGFVYRGSAIAGLQGRYVFADFASGRIWALEDDGSGGYSNEELVSTGVGISSFAVDQDGELYITDFFGGRIQQLVETSAGADLVPDFLSDSGCVDPNDITQPYSGLVPYDINAPFWSDGADKDRHIGVPNGQTIAIDAQDDWEFPPGTVLVKNFRLNGRLIETRHLMRHPDGVWAGYTYEWNAAQTEATRVPIGKIEIIDGQDWIFPDEAECLACHTVAAGRALGPETSQMNRDFAYPQTGRTHGQLETFDGIAMFASPLQGDPATLPAMPDPMQDSANIGERARAYLHTNCAQCHQPGGPTPTSLDLRYTTALANTAACDVEPQSGDLGINMPLIIAPGDSTRSVLVARMNVRDLNSMPPIGSNVIDAAGVTLVTDWINSLASCN